jgi:hypothetical protein
VTDFFYSASFQDSFMVFPCISFLLSCGICIHQFIDICVASTFGLLGIRLLCTLMYTVGVYVCFHLNSLDICLGMELLGHMATQSNLLRICQTFPKCLYHFTFSPVPLCLNLF